MKTKLLIILVLCSTFSRGNVNTNKFHDATDIWYDPVKQILLVTYTVTTELDCMPLQKTILMQLPQPDQRHLIQVSSDQCNQLIRLSEHRECLQMPNSSVSSQNCVTLGYEIPPSLQAQFLQVLDCVQIPQYQLLHLVTLIKNRTMLHTAKSAIYIKSADRLLIEYADGRIMSVQSFKQELRFSCANEKFNRFLENLDISTNYKTDSDIEAEKTQIPWSWSFLDSIKTWVTSTCSCMDQKHDEEEYDEEEYDEEEYDEEEYDEEKFADQLACAAKSLIVSGTGNPDGI